MLPHTKAVALSLENAALIKTEVENQSRKPRYYVRRLRLPDSKTPKVTTVMTTVKVKLRRRKESTVTTKKTDQEH